MLKITKISAVALIFYILFYLQIWGDNHIILYGSAIVSVVSMAIYCFRSGYLHMTNVPFGIWNNLILVCYALVTGYFVAVNYSVVLSSTITLAAFSIVCIAVCYVSTEEKSFDWFLKSIIVLAILCAVYTLVFGTVKTGYGKVLSEKNNPHSLAAVMNLGIFAVAYLIPEDKRKTINISWLLMFFFYYTIIECGSRKYLIVSTFILAIWLWAFLSGKWKTGDIQQRIMASIFLIAAICVFVYMYRRFFLNSYSFSRMMVQDDEGNQNRLAFYRKAYIIFINNPLFGGGYDQFQFWSGFGSYAHSTYAEALADFGLIGCILYFSPLLYTTYLIIKRGLIIRNYNNVLLIALNLAEIFLGIGQIFFMEFSHFLTWTILFYNSQNYIEQKPESAVSVNNQKKINTCKYIRV